MFLKKQKIEQVKDQLQVAPKSESVIFVKNVLFPGVSVTILKANKKFQEEVQASRVYYGEGEILTEAYSGTAQTMCKV